MGLLDPKTRVLDTLLTEEGRIQLSRGKLQICYASFSDGATFYELDAVSGSSDPTSRIYLEASSLPQDQVTFQADDSGKLKPFRNPGGINVISGKLVSGSTVVPVEGTQFVSLSETLLGSSVENFKNLMLIGSLDEIFGENDFALDRSEITFDLTDAVPLSTNNQTVMASHLPGFVDDGRMSHLPNFRFLPPVVKYNNDTVVSVVGNASDNSTYSSSRIFVKSHDSKVKALKLKGAHKAVRISPTSHDNHIFIQVFESNPDGTLTKLDVIKFTDSNRDIYFIGKVIDNGDSDFRFVNIFTLSFGT